MSPTSDQQLVEGFLEGRPEAVRQIDRWLTLVVDNRNWGLSHQREDILQEVRRRLVENLASSRFKGDSSLKTYAVQIARYTCIEFLRSKIRTAAVDVETIELRDPSPNPEQELAANEDHARALRALAALPEGCRELFEMIFRERLPYQEISERLQIAPGTVKSRAWRCREALMKKLKAREVPSPSRAEIRGT